MNSLTNRSLEMFVRVGNFADARASALPEESLGGEAVTELKQVIQALTGAATSQNSGLSSVQLATAHRDAAREDLREEMKLWVRTARAMSLNVPGFENKFRLPRSGSDAALLERAEAFANDALAFKEQFIRYGMPLLFLENFRAKIAKLRGAMEEQNTERGEHVSATAAAETLAEQGMNAVRRLDAFVRNKYRTDPATLAAWESASHVETSGRTRRRTNGSGDNGNSTGGNGGTGDGVGV